MGSPQLPDNPGWYPDPSGAGGQRYWDGRTWSDGPANAGSAPAFAPPPKKRKKWPWIAAAIVGFLIVVGAMSGGGDDKKTDVAAGKSGNSASSNSEAGIGQPVSDGKLEFTVTKMDRSKIAGDPTNEFLQETAQGEFINVHLTVKNTGDKGQSFFSSNQKLIVGGKQFEAASILGVAGDNQNINPGLSVDTVVSFDVPPGSVPEAIEVHDSAFSGGAKIKL